VSINILNYLRKSNFRKKNKMSSPCLPNEIVNIVGDIHGSYNLAKNIFSKINTTEKIIFVGDYVDRGERSLDVIRWLKNIQSRDPRRITCLKGNHEVMMLNFLDDPIKNSAVWLKSGGLQTLASFGLIGIKEHMQADELINVSKELRKKMSDELEDWLRCLPIYWTSGNLWVVHAGADPKIAMNEQSNDTFIWGSKNFMKQQRSDGCWVAHGHTVVSSPEQKDSRISLDTGAYYSGRLTAVRCLPNGEVNFTQAINLI
jgi:serine/threonine protein phosphatase 1